MFISSNKNIVVMLFVLCLFIFLSLSRNSLWIEDLSLTKDTTLKSPGVARVWNNYGSALMKLDRIGDAISALKKSLEMDKWYLESNFNLGICYIKKRMYKEAIDSFEYVLKINDTLRKGHFGASANAEFELEARSNLGNLYTVTGDLEKGIISFNRALKINPEDTSTRFNLAVVYKKAGMIEEAIREFAKVLELDPADRGARFQLNQLKQQ